MAKAFINDENLTDIADAIRATLDESRQYLPSEMAAAIQSIPVMAQLNRKKYFQSVPAGAASGYATIERIEGNTVVWNQLVDTGDTTCTVPNGHVYYANISGTASIATSDGNAFAVDGSTDNVVDLTAIFGAGNEPSTVSDFEAWMAQNGLPSVADYNAGELLSVKMQSVKSVGFNQWDEEWELGDIDGTTGQDVPNNTQIRTHGYTRILPNTQYYILAGTGSIRLSWYDAAQQIVSSTVWINSGIVTSPPTAHYLRFKKPSAYGTTYNHDICINISDPSKNGTYKSYQSDSADIDATTITGVNTATNVRETIFPNGMKQADRAGTVKDTLDLQSDTATVRCGIVDLGSLSWNYSTYYQDAPFFEAVEPNIKMVSSSALANIISARYETRKASVDFGGEKGISSYGFSGNPTKIRIFDPSYTDATTFTNSLNGVYALYELATPITYADLQDGNGNPLNPRYKVEQGGTEQVLPANTSTPTTVAPTLTTTYTKDND